MTLPVAVVTGGSRGIGAAIVARFVSASYRVVSLDLDDSLAHEESSVDPTAVETLVCDVSDEDAVNFALDHVSQRHDRLDVVVNNAGIVLVRPLSETTWTDYRRVVDVNLGGVFLISREAVRIMREHGEGGSIVNVASVSGHVGQTDHAVYGATKGAVLAFTRALAWEVAADGIRVNSVSPGSVDTAMLRADVELEADRYGNSVGEVRGAREAEQAFGRWAQPAEVAEAVYFMSSEKASFITGTDLLVDGGWVAK